MPLDTEVQLTRLREGLPDPTRVLGWRATVIDEHLGRKTRQGNESTDKGNGEPLVMC